MANTPTREHREAIFRALHWEPQDEDERRWIETGDGYIGRSFPKESIVSGRDFSLLAQALADAESAAFERGREAERAEVAASLKSRGYIMLASDIRAGKHLAKEE